MGLALMAEVALAVPIVSTASASRAGPVWGPGRQHTTPAAPRPSFVWQHLSLQGVAYALSPSGGCHQVVNAVTTPADDHHPDETALSLHAPPLTPPLSVEAHNHCTQARTYAASPPSPEALVSLKEEPDC